MHYTMDEVKYNNLGIHGKSLLLAKHFSNKQTPVEERFPVTEPNHPTPEQKAAVTFVVRHLKPEEASDISRLAYRTYGYTYVYEHLYFPERIVKLNESKEFISFVAVTCKGEIAGHVGLIADREFAGLYEMAAAMMDPQFRGYGILDDICTAIMEEAKTMEITSIFVQANTVHTRSQSAPMKLGFKPCMLLLSYAPSLDVKNIVSSDDKRQSMVVSFLSFKTHTAKNLYVPERHGEIIQKIYNGLGADYSFMKGEAANESTLSLLSVRVNHVSKLMRIVVKEAGADIIHQLKLLIHKLKEEKLALCELLLNMNSPGIWRHFESIEQLGFLFSGIFPCRETGDSIVMILLNGINACFDNIQLKENNGQYLLEYIRNDYSERFL
jgi:serine/threonine-protein kinase RsbW